MIRTTCAATAALGCLAVAAAPACGADDFFKGKTVTLIVGYSAGSSYDVSGRLLSRHYGRHIPGNPSIIVKNMPGSSSLKAANYIYNVASKDGLSIGSIRNGMAFEQMYGNKAVRFDALKFGWLGSMNRTTGSCVIWHTAPAKTLDDVKKVEIVSGAIGTTASLAMYPRALNAMVGTRFKVVVGYTGTGTMLAMERGETHARCGGDWDTLKTARPDWFRDKKIRLLAQMTNVKHPELENAPWVFDYVKKKEDVQPLQLIFASQEFGRPYVAPPGLPAEHLDMLRRAFDATMQDAEFRADAERLKIKLIGPMTGEKMLERIAYFHKMPQSVVDRVKSFQKATAGEGKVERTKK